MAVIIIERKDFGDVVSKNCKDTTLHKQTENEKRVQECKRIIVRCVQRLSCDGNFGEQFRLQLTPTRRQWRWRMVASWSMGVWDRAPSQGVRRFIPLKLNALLHYSNLKSRPICHEICFCWTKNFRRPFGGHVPSCPWIRQWCNVQNANPNFRHLLLV